MRKETAMLKKAAVVFAAAIIVFAAVGTAAGMFSPLTEERPELAIPSAETVEQDGYPVNQNGETYGPDVRDSIGKSPDLILVCNDNGEYGYIKNKDIISADTLEDAGNFEHRTYCVDMYLQDGETVVGEFKIG